MRRYHAMIPDKDGQSKPVPVFLAADVQAWLEKWQQEYMEDKDRGGYVTIRELLADLAREHKEG